jgi:hypothetical protein
MFSAPKTRGAHRLEFLSLDRVATEKRNAALLTLGASPSHPRGRTGLSGPPVWAPDGSLGLPLGRRKGVVSGLPIRFERPKDGPGQQELSALSVTAREGTTISAGADRTEISRFR